MSLPRRSCRFWLTLLIGLLALAGLAGCQDNPQAASTQQLPWDRQASWEGGIPGMNGDAPKY
ncbi:MAG: hypothetical protein ABSH19_05465 [Opitutales bacterium]